MQVSAKWLERLLLTKRCGGAGRFGSVRLATDCLPDFGLAQKVGPPSVAVHGYSCLYMQQGWAHMPLKETCWCAGRAQLAAVHGRLSDIRERPLACGSSLCAVTHAHARGKAAVLKRILARLAVAAAAEKRVSCTKP